MKDKIGKTHLYMWGLNNYGQQGDGKNENVKTPTEVKFDKNVKKITQISMSGYTSSALVQGLDNKTHLYMWGFNKYGQQGDETINNVTTPTEVTNLNQFLPTGATITKILMSEYTSSVLVRNDKGKTHLYMWGSNASGQQGDGGKTDNIKTPTKVKFENVKNITQISMSDWTSSALVQGLDNKTHLYMWGADHYGQQGDGKAAKDRKNITIPTKVKFFDSLRNELTITQISMSESTSSALVRDDRGKTHLYMWGYNSSGQQGDGKADKDRKNITIPTKVEFFDSLRNELTITQISMSESTSSALVQGLDNKTHLYMWGYNSSGQQGDQTTNNVIAPTKVNLSNNLTITQILMSNHTSSALVQGLDNKTHLYMWGSNMCSQQGQGDRRTNVKTPTDILTTLESKFKDVKSTNILTTFQIVWIFVGALLFVILSGLIIGFLYKKRNKISN